MNKLSYGIKDDEFIRGKVPMTKEEVRVLTLSKLALEADDVVLDIGAGTGSISIECACILKTPVYAIECKAEAISLIHKNKEKFQVNNLKIIEGFAPDVIPNEAITKVVIGGTRGRMEPVFEHLEKLPIKKVVVNTITLENTTHALECMKKYNYRNIDVLTVNISKGHFVGKITMMKAHNPITIITGEKDEN